MNKKSAECQDGERRPVTWESPVIKSDGGVDKQLESARPLISSASLKLQNIVFWYPWSSWLLVIVYSLAKFICAVQATLRNSLWRCEQTAWILLPFVLYHSWVISCMGNTEINAYWIELNWYHQLVWNFRILFSDILGGVGYTLVTICSLAKITCSLAHSVKSIQAMWTDSLNLLILFDVIN